jgi:hypothetical protein
MSDKAPVSDQRFQKVHNDPVRPPVARSSWFPWPLRADAVAVMRPVMRCVCVCRQRFARNSKRKSKLKIDKRFAAVLHDDRFKSVQGV